MEVMGQEAHVLGVYHALEGPGHGGRVIGIPLEELGRKCKRCTGKLQNLSRHWDLGAPNRFIYVEIP